MSYDSDMREAVEAVLPGVEVEVHRIMGGDGSYDALLVELVGVVSRMSWMVTLRSLSAYACGVKSAMHEEALAIAEQWRAA